MNLVLLIAPTISLIQDELMSNSMSYYAIRGGVRFYLIHVLSNLVLVHKLGVKLID